MSDHWKNIIGANDPESFRIVDTLFEDIKDNKSVFRILAALQSRVNEYHAPPMKHIKTFRGQKDIKDALENAGVISLFNGRPDAFTCNAGWLDHFEIGKDSKDKFHLIGRPYGLFLDLKTLDQFKKMIEAGLSVCIGADRTHFPGWTVEIDVTKDGAPLNRNAWFGDK